MKGVTVQKMCRVSKDEKEVRELIDKVWKEPETAEAVLSEAAAKNSKVYEFEKMLEDK